MEHALQHELQVAERLAREAGALVARYFGSPIPVEYKPGDEGPVTQADREANDVLVRGLAREFPHDAILSEEAPDDGSRHSAKRVWMVDPLDGTSDFIRGRDGFSTMIGLLEGGRPVLGVIYQPTADALYLAARGTGAILVERSGGTTREHVLRASRVSDVEKLRLVASKSHRSEVIDEVRAKLGVTDELNIGSVGLKLGLIARGERELYVNPESHSSLWDTCGPEALLEEAGGKLTDLEGRPLDYTSPSVKNARGLIASNGILHAAVVKRLATLFPPRG